MINILVLRNKQNIITIEATGHSGYAEAGSDIVCSSVSTLLQSLINGLVEVVKVQPKYTIDEDIPHLSVSIDKNLDRETMSKVQILMQSTYLSLVDISNSYAKFIKIKEKQSD
ncbi:MAG: ribosomal-processing cysteine protease Prp [Clostridia bacterium]|nr:ribosomal-processing cysteine protease Prp [Clostridia bacterium]